MQLVEELKATMSINEICSHLGVSRSSYYRWKKSDNKNETNKMVRDKKIGELCKLHRFRYGYRKITSIFGEAISKETVRKVMQKYGWQCRVKVKKRKRTGQPAYVAQNIINRDFTASAPFQKLVTDIT